MDTKQYHLTNRACFLAVMFSLVLSGCRKESTSIENPIASVEKFLRYDTEVEIPDILEIGPKEGFYAILELAPKANYTSMEYGNAAVTKASGWPCVGICFPKGEDRDSENSVRFAFYAINRPVQLLAMDGPQRQLPNFKGMLQTDYQTNGENVAFSTFLGPTHNQAGDYVLEIYIAPTCVKTKYRSTPGKLLLVHRQEIRLLKDP